MTMTIAAPASCARRLRSAQTRELKCVVVTITGTRPATWPRIAAASDSRSSSASANCSEKLARMHRPSDPASIMKSTQRFWLSRSSAPRSSKVVGTTGNTPLYRGFVDGLMGSPGVASRSVVVARHGRPAPADEEVEVGALIGLQHVVDVELGVAPRGGRFGRAPGGAARRQLRLVHMQVQAAGRDVERDHVAVPHQRE